MEIKMKIEVMYGGSGAVNVPLPSGKVFKAQFVSPRPHRTSADVTANIKDAVEFALNKGQNWRVLRGGSIHDVEFDDEIIRRMESAHS